MFGILFFKIEKASLFIARNGPLTTEYEKRRVFKKTTFK